MRTAEASTKLEEAHHVAIAVHPDGQIVPWNTIANTRSAKISCGSSFGRHGFVTENPFPDSSPRASYIEDVLHKHGPWMLMHLTSDLAPGIGPNSSHAVVITGIDVTTNQVWFNNPWGNINQVTTVDSILRTMENLQSKGIRSVAYMP